MRAPILVLTAALGMAASSGASAAHDYPTIERVRYVQECMAENPGPAFEMTSKCVCALEALREQVPTEQFIEMSTAAKATTIGGERGGYIRDAEQLQVDIRRWRELQRKVKAGCFIGAGPR